MKYSLLLIISLFSLTALSAKNNVEEVSGNILDLRKKNTPVLIVGNDTIPNKQKNGDVFYFDYSKDIVINKVLLSDTAKASHLFKVTSNGKLVVEESKDKKSHDQNIQVLLYNVYTLYWGGINWKICCSDEFSRKFDLILLDTKQISIKDKKGEKIEDIEDNGSFALNDTVTVNSVQFPAAGHLVVECNDDKLLERNVRRVEENLGLTLYKGKSYIFTLGEKSWKIGVKEEPSTSTDISLWLIGIFLGIVSLIIAFVLLKNRKLIKNIFVRYEKLATKEGLIIRYKSKDGLCTGATASPNGFYTLDDGRSMFLNKGITEWIFPAGSLKKTDCYGKDIIINREKGNPQLGDVAYPNGRFLLSDGTTFICVEGYRIKDIRKIGETDEIEEPEQLPASAQVGGQASFDWHASLTEDTVQKLASVDLRPKDFSSLDEFCISLANSMSVLKESLKENPNPQEEKDTLQQAIDNLLNNLITKMRNKRIVKDTFNKLYNNKKDYKGEISKIKTDDDFILFIEGLLTPKSDSDAYTLEQLKEIANSKPLSEITNELKNNVFDVYTKRYITTKLELGNYSNTVLAKAANDLGYVIIKSEELNRHALDIIGKSVSVSFTSLEDFKTTWESFTKTKPVGTPNIDKESVLLERLKKISDVKNQSVSDILDELEKSSSTHGPEKVLIYGRSEEEIKQDLGEYEKLKPLSELSQYGATAEAIKKNLLLEGQTKLETAVKQTVSDAIPNIQIIEPFKNLKRMVEGIHKADSAEQMANAIGRVSTLIEDISSLQDEKERALREKKAADTLIINKVKSHFQNLFKEELSPDGSIDAINRFVEHVKKVIDGLNNEIIEKEKIIRNKESVIGNQQKVIDQKESEIKVLCKDYSNFIVTAFEQVEKDLVRACQNAKTSDALPAKFIQRVIQNDAFNVNDFMDEMKKIINNPSLGHKEIITSLHNLFLDTVQSNSWVQTLSHIYLYVQKPEVASYFTKNKIDVGCINASFILTEQMMRALGIELHYPKLFEDIFDSNLYDESTLSDVKDYVNDVKELIGDRQGVIIDMFRLGYTSDGQTHKAKVTRFN